MRRLSFLFVFCVACSASSAASESPVSETDAGETADRQDAGVGRDAAVTISDAAIASVKPAASIDSGDSVSTWALYTIATGAHSATISSASSGAPIEGLISGKAGRDYLFAFDSSAMYTITAPVQPSDQLDWNKLPGISDCNQLDLSVDGVMFGWRWRLDKTPNVLEITAYANDSSTHLEAASPLLTLDADDLASITPLHYRLWIDGANYQFSIDGTMRGRTISATSTLARACTSTAASDLDLQWGAGFYFGGTSTAPQEITGRVFEQPF